MALAYYVDDTTGLGGLQAIFGMVMKDYNRVAELNASQSASSQLTSSLGVLSLNASHLSASVMSSISKLTHLPSRSTLK
jgi:hypothetical protein